MRKAMREEVVRQVLSDPHAQAELEKEFTVLREDRELLRQIFNKGDSRVRFLGCNTAKPDIFTAFLFTFQNPYRFSGFYFCYRIISCYW